MITEKKEYILVMPSKKVIPVEDIEFAKAYVNRYYERKIEICKGDKNYEEHDLSDDETREEVFRTIGNEEGEPMLYDTDSVIEAVRESDFFDDEQEEIITKLLLGDTDIEIDKYSLDIILVNIEPIELLSN